MKSLRALFAGMLAAALGLLLFVRGDESPASAVSDQAAPKQEAADTAARAEHEWFHPPTRLTAADGVIDSGPAWGHSGPWVEDVDGDRVKDLVVGDFSGLFKLYRNEGTNRQPRYAKPVNLQAGGVDAKVPIY